MHRPTSILAKTSCSWVSLASWSKRYPAIHPTVTFMLGIWQSALHSLCTLPSCPSHGSHILFCTTHVLSVRPRACLPSNPTSRCLVITGMQRYDQIDKDAPFAVAFDKVRKMLLAAIPEFVQAASKWLTCPQALPISFCASQYCTWTNTAWPMERLFVHAIAPLGRQGKASGLSLAHC